MQICWNFFDEKMWHIFLAKNIRILYIASAKTVNEMTLNELVKLMMPFWMQIRAQLFKANDIIS